MKSKKKIILIILLIILIIFLLFLFMHIIVGNNTKVDKENKLSDDEIINYISNYMQKKYDKDFKIELITKDEVIYKKGFSFMGVPTGQKSYKVNGSYKYEFKITDKDNVVATAKYTDAYYVDQTYYNVTFEEDYGEIISIKERSKILEEIALQYFDNEEIIKYEYIDKTLNTVTGKSVIYLNYDINDITKKIIGKLLAIGLDYDLNNAYVVFLNSPDKFYSISPEELETIYKTAFNVNEIGEETNISRQEVYNDLYSALKNETELLDSDIKNIEEIFFWCVQDFIDVYDKFYDLEVGYDLQTKICYFKIYTNTLNNNKIELSARFYYNNELEKYEGEHITVWDPNSRWSLTLYKN